MSTARLDATPTPHHAAADLTVPAVRRRFALEPLQLANPRGFCAGVGRAIEIVERALAKFGAPIYVRHEIVHNTHVVSRLRGMGAVFIEDLQQVPAGGIVVFSAHGVSKAVRAQAEALGLRIFDATCPLVTKVHVEVGKLRQEGRRLVMIGHRGHPEVEGTMGQMDDAEMPMLLVENVEDVARLPLDAGQPVAYVTQTTLSVDDTEQIVAALRARFPSIAAPKKQDICYATQNRQDAVKRLAHECELILIVGSPTSSNSNRLREVAEREGCRAYMVDSADDLREDWFVDVKRVGLSAGASAPEVLVEQVINRLHTFSDFSVTQQVGEIETVRFPLPKGI